MTKALGMQLKSSLVRFIILVYGSIFFGVYGEAEFCRLARQWYETEDESGISSKERCELIHGIAPGV